MPFWRWEKYHKNHSSSKIKFATDPKSFEKNLKSGLGFLICEERRELFFTKAGCNTCCNSNLLETKSPESGNWKDIQFTDCRGKMVINFEIFGITKNKICLIFSLRKKCLFKFEGEASKRYKSTFNAHYNP